jgi:hypothetical protein
MSCTMRTGGRRWRRGVSPVGSRAVMGTAREKPDALYCDCGIGALETMQQEISDAATS